MAGQASLSRFASLMPLLSPDCSRAPGCAGIAMSMTAAFGAPEMAARHALYSSPASLTSNPCRFRYKRRPSRLNASSSATRIGVFFVMLVYDFWAAQSATMIDSRYDAAPTLSDVFAATNCMSNGKQANIEPPGRDPGTNEAMPKRHNDEGVNSE